MTIAQADLNPSNPVMLGTALNLSILQSELHEDKILSVEITQIVVKEADEFINDFEGEYDFTDSVNLLVIMKENLKLWKEEANDRLH